MLNKIIDNMIDIKSLEYVTNLSFFNNHRREYVFIN